MKTAVILQCRLSSTRLPGKALIPLGKKTVFEHVLSSMKKVHADEYCVATDGESFSKLKPYADKYGYKLFKGSLNDVLDRYLGAIKMCGADVVVRGTCDNPFLFYEAAQKTLDEFLLLNQKEKTDYFTHTGLPHGSGVEVFLASSLIKAASLTSDLYDHEHVGPALYNHADVFNCVFKKAPDEFYFPELRTTVDTLKDLRRVQNAFYELKALAGSNEGPFSASQIISAFKKEKVSHPFIFFPCIKEGHGTGHLRRCLSLAASTGGHIFIDRNSTYKKLQNLDELIAQSLNEGLKKEQIRTDFSSLEEYETIFTDLFKAPRALRKKLYGFNVVSLDEGSVDKNFASYRIDILPPLKIRSNIQAPFLIPLPENRRSFDSSDKIEKVLICIGGEDKNCVGKKLFPLFKENGFDVTLVSSSNPVENLREKLFNYDLVVTHFGFTAYEAKAAGCRVLLAETSPLHKKLSVKNGFAVLEKKNFSHKGIKKVLSEFLQFDVTSGAAQSAELNAGPTGDSASSNGVSAAFASNGEAPAKTKSLEDAVLELATSKKHPCPVCASLSGKIVSRVKDRTFKKCAGCGMTYISFSVSEKKDIYNHDYFFEGYKKQYGKTYLDDFESIKVQGLRRVKNIQEILRIKNNIKNNGAAPSVLDIGCAMGAFLSAARDKGFDCYGTDIFDGAVDYVKKEIGIKACVSVFPDFNPHSSFGLNEFDAVSLWYVIEHFEDLRPVLKKLSSLVKKGGVLCFSTPSASGVSARFNRKTFFEQSPSDHFTLWKPHNAGRILKPYGFRVKKIVSTGIHPERIKLFKNVKSGTFAFKVLNFFLRLCKMGDTFEIYLRRIK